MIDEETDCHNCGEDRAVILCLVCGIPLCSACVKLGDYAFVRDGGNIMAFCPDCFVDPTANTVLKFED